MEAWRGVPGNFTFPEFYDWLVDELYQQQHDHDDPLAHGLRTIVEVGVNYGQSAMYLREACDKMNLFAQIDLVDIGLERARAYLPTERFGRWLHMPSVQAAREFKAGSVDAVFIDADHSYEGVKADIAAWLPVVRKGGILAGHDYCAEFPGVIEAVIEAFDGAHSTMTCSPWKDGRIVGEGEGGNYYPCWWVKL